MKDLLGFVLVSVAIVAVGFMAKPAQVNVETDNLGSFGGPEVPYRLTTKAGFAQGGVFTVSTSSATLTVKDGDLANAATISIVQSSTTATFDPALTLTLPASTTWPSLDANGTVQSWIVDNNQTGAATTTTIAAGAGVDIDGTTANDDVINGGVSGRLDCWRLPTTGNIRCIVEEMVDAG